MNTANKNSFEGLYKELAEKVTNEIKENGSTLLKFNPIKLDFSNDAELGDLLKSDYLRNINLNYSYPLTLQDLSLVTTPRKGLVGKVVLKIKRRIQKFIAGILINYTEAQKNFNGDTVRFLNEVSRYVDKRDNANFLELIRKIDTDLESLNRKFEELSDKQSVTELNVKQKLESSYENNFVKFAKENRLRDNNIQIRITSLFSALDNLEGMIKRLTNNQESKQNQVNSNVSNDNLSNIDYSYLFLENRYRGSSEEIKAKVKKYADIIKTIDCQNKNVVEIGAGRGELLELLGEENINAVGVETDSGMCEVLKEKKLEYVNQDGLSYLKTLKDNSVSCIIAIQVIEHLSFDYINALMKESYRVLQNGGKLIFETINPLSFYALTQNFFKDYTHKWPIHPDVIKHFSKLEGFSGVDILKLSEVSENEKLSMLTTDEAMIPSMVEFISKYNKNVEKLNNLLYGFQDYALIAKK